MAMTSLKDMSTRQKITAVFTILVVLVLIWQIKGLFGSSSPASAPIVAANTAPTAKMQSAATPPSPSTPKPANIFQNNQPMTEREAELMKLQQDTQTKYMAAINELQLLKVARDIALANKDISTANLAKVTSEKKIVDLLAPAPPPPTPATEATNKALITQAAQTMISSQVTYSVVSVSQVQHVWNAVLNYKGSFYNVHVGDVLAADNSKVVAISRDGVTIERDGARHKLPLVTTI